MAGWISLGLSGATIVTAFVLWIWKGANSWSWVKRSIRSYLDGSEALRQMVFQMYGALTKARLIPEDCATEVLKVWGEAGFGKPMQELRNAVGKGNPMTREEFDKLTAFMNKAGAAPGSFDPAEAEEFRDLALKFMEEVKQFAGRLRDDTKALEYLRAGQNAVDASAYVYGKTKNPVPT
jgi:hypothetical protein